MYCKNCGKKTDKKAAVCINCGYAVKTKGDRNKIRFGLYLFIILFFYTILAFKDVLEELIRTLISAI